MNPGSVGLGVHDWAIENAEQLIAPALSIDEVFKRFAQQRSGRDARNCEAAPNRPVDSRRAL